jgi:hypothetical protein
MVMEIAKKMEILEVAGEATIMLANPRVEEVVSRSVPAIGIVLVAIATLPVALIAVVVMLQSQNLLAQLISLEEVAGEIQALAIQDPTSVLVTGIALVETAILLVALIAAVAMLRSQNLLAQLISLEVVVETPPRKNHARCTFLQNQPTTKPKCSPIIFSLASISTNLIRFQ